MKLHFIPWTTLPGDVVVSQGVERLAGITVELDLGALLSQVMRTSQRRGAKFCD